MFILTCSGQVLACHKSALFMGGFTSPWRSAAPHSLPHDIQEPVQAYKTLKVSAMIISNGRR